MKSSSQVEWVDSCLARGIRRRDGDLPGVGGWAPFVLDRIIVAGPRGMVAGDLAAALPITAPTARRYLRRMAARGLLRVVTEATGGRPRLRYVWAPTVAALERVSEIGRLSRERIAARLSARDRAQDAEYHRSAAYRRLVSARAEAILGTEETTVMGAQMLEWAE